MGSDGVRRGYDIEQLRAVRAICHRSLRFEVASC